MSSRFGKPPDPVAESASLTAEATVLAARLRILREDLASVDARIGAVSEALRLLYHPEPSAAPDGAGDRNGPPE